MASKTVVEAPFRPLKAAAPALNGVPAEIVAAISAAVACMCSDGARIMSIKPAKRGVAGGRPAWAMAGLLDTTRAF